MIIDFPVKKPLTASVISLVLANLVPVAGGFFLHWSVFALLFAYWLENIVIGFYNVLKILKCGAGPIRKFQTPNLQTHVPKAVIAGGRVLIILFFMFQFGVFIIAHGVFVFALFYEPGLTFFDVGLMFTVLTISHGISYTVNFLGKKEYEKLDLGQVYKAPYSRVVIMHFVIIFGGFLLTEFQDRKLALILLVVLKTAFDLKAHLSEHVGTKKQNQFTSDIKV